MSDPSISWHWYRRGSSTAPLPARLAAKMHSVSEPHPVSTQSPSSQAWNSGHSSFSVHGFSQALSMHSSSESLQSSFSTHSTQRPSSQMSFTLPMQSSSSSQLVSGRQSSSSQRSVHTSSQSGSVQMASAGL